MRKKPFVAADHGSIQQQLDALAVLLDQAHVGAWTLSLLIDTALDARTGSGWREARSLYEGTRWEALSEMSPRVLELRHDDLPRLRNALVRASGLPMLSLLASRLPIAELMAYWRTVLAVRDPDGEELLLRWADTRCSAYLADALEPVHWQRLTAPLHAWWIVDRSGQVRQLPVDPAVICPTSDMEPALPIELSQDEFGRLIAWAEPDAVLSVLAEQVPELLPDQGLAQAHALATQVCGLARRHGATGTPDLIALTVFALGEGAEALSRPDLPGLLEGVAAQPGSLANRLAALP